MLVFNQFVKSVTELSKHWEMEYVVDDYIDKRFIAFEQK